MNLHLQASVPGRNFDKRAYNQLVSNHNKTLQSAKYIRNNMVKIFYNVYHSDAYVQILAEIPTGNTRAWNKHVLDKLSCFHWKPGLQEFHPGQGRGG